jgi:hypothetical protein
MGKAIEITLLERSAAELRELAARTRDGAVVRRLLGIALLLDGWSRGEAATACPGEGRGRAEWTVRLCATGCIATTCLMLPDWKPGSALGARRR